jgi:hypothetical protein
LQLVYALATFRSAISAEADHANKNPIPCNRRFSGPNHLHAFDCYHLATVANPPDIGPLTGAFLRPEKISQILNFLKKNEFAKNIHPNFSA